MDSRIETLAFICLMFLPADIHSQELKDTLSASRVTADFSVRQSAAQTGFMRLERVDLEKMSVACTPDIVKTIQMLPGVASGTEISSGMYVRGGDGADNLFLLDGVPVYQPGHLGGLFSAVNTDIVETADFYKSGFPSMFGGRASSVLNIRTMNGNPDSLRIRFSAGMTEGRFAIDGPIGKSCRQTFTAAARFSLLELFARPLLKLYNEELEYRAAHPYISDGDYGYAEVNAKYSLRLPGGRRFTAGAMYSRDFLKYDNEDYNTTTGLRSSWGNFLCSADYRNSSLSRVITYESIYVTNGNARIGINRTDDMGSSKDRSEEKNHSRILDIGLKSVNLFPHRQGYLRFGGEAVCHISKPDRVYLYERKDNGKVSVSDNISSTKSYTGYELDAFVEEEWTPLQWLALQGGLRYSLYFVRNRTYGSIEPRASLSVRPFSWLAVKASYDRMSQQAHLLASSFVDFPSNCWMPSTDRIAPVKSGQLTAGIEVSLPEEWNLSAEVFSKTMTNLYEYTGALMLYPPLDRWETSFTEGKGRAEGLEVSVSGSCRRFDVFLAYTLSVSERKFPEIYDGWYPDRFDNRHKFNVMLRKKGKRVDWSASWTYHSGNRATIDTHYGFAVRDDGSSYVVSYPSGKPNQFLMPAYHRLDLGVDFHRVNRAGHYRVFSLGIYNVYCRYNPMYVQQRIDQQYGQPELVYVSMLPIIPTFRLAYEF